MLSDRSVSLNGVSVPRFLYGTAWKEQATQGLTEQALALGFRGIDTANQRRHYDESAVGSAIAAAVAAGMIARDDLFLQTKFTFRSGQDHRLPYDPVAPIARQVEQSFASSCQHLGTDRIDSYLLHGPMVSEGLSPADWDAWQAIEAIHQRGGATIIGVSNFSAAQLRLLLQEATVKPMCVQNRCYAIRGWDRQVRQLCHANRLLYQGFSLLTANQQVLVHPIVVKIAERHQRTVAQTVFRFAIEADIVPLTGTRDPQHMQQDLQVLDFQLDPSETASIENVLAV